MLPAYVWKPDQQQMERVEEQPYERAGCFVQMIAIFLSLLYYKDNLYVFVSLIPFPYSVASPLPQRARRQVGLASSLRDASPASSL
jgi:hypothetical protein